jgi:DNA-binding XRE family transcriptional regulator
VTPSPIVAALTQARIATRLADGGPATQSWLARKLGVTPGTVSGWEVGRYDPAIGHAEAWAEALGLRLELLPALSVPEPEGEI